MVTELKKLDPQERSFVANGNKYYISSELSVARFHEFQILEIEAKMNMTLKDAMTKMAQIWQMLNKNEIGNGLVEFHKLMEGMREVGHREHVLLRICALFINRENEDLSKVSEDLISQKIEDWSEYEVNGFFSLALNSTNGFFKDYNKMLQIISGQGASPADGAA